MGGGVPKLDDLLDPTLTFVDILRVRPYRSFEIPPRQYDKNRIRMYPPR